MHRIETERLVLRPFVADDWRDFQELSVDWQAAPGPAFDKWPTSEQACRASVQHLSTRDNYLAVCLRATGKVVGLPGIKGIDPEHAAQLAPLKSLGFATADPANLGELTLNKADWERRPQITAGRGPEGQEG